MANRIIQGNGTGVMSGALIFVVDDEPAIAEVHTLVLQRNGYNAIAFTNPLTALCASDLKPDLLLSDFYMPQMDGLSLATELQMRCPTCKVLMISGAIRQAMNHPAMGRFEFLEKPVPARDLLARIKATLESDPV
jgi:DNA-binding NtrC family response regulator